MVDDIYFSVISCYAFPRQKLLKCGFFETVNIQFSSIFHLGIDHWILNIGYFNIDNILSMLL